jgi:hydrophobic/amphiphilic exporter-1 (mainly G- bacteria), HAE1 family
MDEGESALNAALDGAKLRFRPILMTSFAFILGVVPLLTATGAGSQARVVMGMAVFSGMITATVIGCILIPSFFVLIERKKNKEKKSGGTQDIVFDSGNETKNH